MTGPATPDDEWPLNRRSALKLTGGILLAGALGGQAGAVHGFDTAQRVYRVKQGTREFEVDLLVGETPVRELYDLRIPNYYGGDNGSTDPGEGPYYESAGLSYLLEESSTVMFLYDGPDGVSLVAVHGGGNSEGNVTWRVTGIPSTAKWLVKDDLYTYPDTGEIASSNNDRWDVSGSEHVVDWTWRNSQTDGGVIGYLDGEFSITIDPAYNEAATLYGEYYEGDIISWQVLTGSWNSLTRESLNLTDPVTITCETVVETETPVTPEPEEEEPTESPEEEDPTEEPTEEPESQDEEAETEKPEWKEDRDEAREEWKEDRDEWQQKRDDGDDDWKEARDEAREERKEKREDWKDKRDEWQDDEDDDDKDDDKDDDDDDDERDGKRGKKDKKPKKSKKPKKGKKPKKPKKGKKGKRGKGRR
ncbi:hypothetical protein [Haloferax sp. YSMS24]|uniref:hypothetical protein n=1 Tax=Haloferax sp. YSMS24 TaxID=3388425 RepID=UPI00398D0E8E